MTFDVKAQVFRSRAYDWQNTYEIFCVCRRCSAPTTFVVTLKQFDAQATFAGEDGLVRFGKTLNSFFDVKGFVNLSDLATPSPPEHVPAGIEGVFREGAACVAIQCPNAAACMFRLCVDLATKPLLPDPADQACSQPNQRQRRDLGLRLAWLLDNGVLPEGLREIARCIREDANDGAHVGNLSMSDAEDLLEFTTILLERLYTEPERLKIAEARRAQRRQQKTAN